MDSRDPQHFASSVAAGELVAAARSLLGTPYRHQGASAIAVDCIGLIRAACTRAGIELPGVPHNYGRFPAGELRALAAQHCRPLPRPIAGALLLMRWPGHPEPSHCALHTGANLIHACTLSGKVIEHGYRGQWLKLTDSIWALPAVRYG